MVRTGEWLSEAWEVFKQDTWMHILLALIVGVGGSVTGGILYGPLMCGYYYVVLNKLRNPSYSPELNDLGKGFDVFLHALVASLIIGVFVNVGASACFVGSIVVAAFLVFAYPLIMDKKMDFWPAIETSFNKAKDNWLGFSLFMLALLGINLAGALLCGLGLLVTGPLTFIATAIAYRDNFLTQTQVPDIPEAPNV